MASLSKDKNGTKRIQWVDADSKRHTIRLGKINVKAAEAFLARLERLVASRLTGTPVDGQTAQWLAELPDGLYGKLVGQGLADAREVSEAHTLGAMLDEYFQTMSVKESTRTRYGQTKRLLIDHFGRARALDSITTRDCDQWRVWLTKKNYASAKIGKEVSIARMFIRQAVRWGMIPANPFEGVRGGSQSNRARLHYIPLEQAHKLIQAAPDADWRCIIALARFGGLRCPSEVLGVRWADVDWAHDRFRVRSPKTERHEGKGERLVPLFPELRSVLMEAFEQAPEGADFVVQRFRDKSGNLRTQLERIIERAGLEKWPRLFNAMRASRATELAAQYPAAICTAWMGHTRAVAEAHYHMVRDEDFDRAAATPIAASASASVSECGALVSQNASQQQAAVKGNAARSEPQTQTGPALMPVPAEYRRWLQDGKMGLDRLELSTSPLSAVRSTN